LLTFTYNFSLYNTDDDATAAAADDADDDYDGNDVIPISACLSVVHSKSCVTSLFTGSSLQFLLSLSVARLFDDRRCRCHISLTLSVTFTLYPWRRCHRQPRRATDDNCCRSRQATNFERRRGHSAKQLATRCPAVSSSLW